MLGGDLKEKLLEKIIELFQNLPDKEDEQLEKPETEGAELIAAKVEPMEKEEKAL